MNDQLLKEMQRHIDKVIDEQNNLGIEDFEGYSPVEMYYLIYDTFGELSPLKLLKLSDYGSIPILCQIKYLTRLISEKGEIKLTAKGFLPPAIVLEIYARRFITEDFIEAGVTKLRRETDSISIFLSRILLELAGLIKKRSGRISLTKKGEKIIEDDSELFTLVFGTMGSRLNWSYFDAYGDNKIGQLGYGFSLLLLSKYGEKERPDSFYADKYFKAFPRLVDDFNAINSEGFDRISSCYALRTFERSLKFFGLITLDSKWNEMSGSRYVSKTPLFDKLIDRAPHRYIKSDFGRSE